MHFDVAELIKTLGSLASISSGYLNVKKAIVDSGRAQRTADGSLQGSLTAEQKQSILQPRIQASGPNLREGESLQVISTDLLEIAMQRIKAAQQRLVKAIRDGLISEIEQEEALTRSEVCYLLSLVLQHNGGRFPFGSSLERIWMQFRCTPLYPQFGIRSF